MKPCSRTDRQQTLEPAIDSGKGNVEAFVDWRVAREVIETYK